MSDENGKNGTGLLKFVSACLVFSFLFLVLCAYLNFREILADKIMNADYVTVVTDDAPLSTKIYAALKEGGSGRIFNVDTHNFYPECHRAADPMAGKPEILGDCSAIDKK